MWAKIGRYCKAHKITLPSLKRILVAGAPVSPSLVRQFRDILPNGVLHTPYGATECLPVSSISGPEILNETWAKTEKGKGTCVGSLLPEIEAKIIPATDKAIEGMDKVSELPLGEIGEIILTGPVVTRRYDHLEEETRKAKIPGIGGSVWHRMGDLGYLDENGRLWFCGRKAEQVQTSQGPLYTDCCEAIFNCHPDVFRSALIGLGPPGKQIPAIVIEPEKEKFPKGKVERERFAQSLKELGALNESTRRISLFFFQKSFPVDVRHNAKIHRLTLKRLFEQKKLVS